MSEPPAFASGFGEASPSVVREKTCGACGEAFDCCAGDCWCDAVTLDAATRARLRAQYADCLCAACLRGFAAGASAPAPGV
jgi:hypothetical protein